MKNIKENIYPTLVLVSITLIVTVILAFTYSATAPTIAELQKKTADEARSIVLSEADSFSEVNKDEKIDKDGSIVEVYKAQNGAGYAITSLDSGFGGEITVMTGIDSNGKISGVKVLGHSETPGLGTQAMTEDFLKQYIGAAGVVLSKNSEKESGSNSADTSVDSVTGATITSEAVFRAVEKAMKYYEQAGGEM